MPRIRFSLMTLILVIVATGAGIGLWRRGRAPWKKIKSYEVTAPPSSVSWRGRGENAAVSTDGRWVATLNNDGSLNLLDRASEQGVWRAPLPAAVLHVKMRFVDDDRLIELRSDPCSVPGTSMVRNFPALHCAFSVRTGEPCDSTVLGELDAVPWAWRDDLQVLLLDPIVPAVRDAPCGQFTIGTLQRVSYTHCVCSISPSRDRFVLPGDEYNPTRVFDRDLSGRQDWRLLVEIDDRSDHNAAARFVSDDLLLLVREDRTTLWQRQFPEWWWGRFWLPESWILIVSLGLLIYRIVRAHRRPRHVHTL